MYITCKSSNGTNVTTFQPVFKIAEMQMKYMYSQSKKLKYFVSRIIIEKKV